MPREPHISDEDVALLLASKLRGRVHHDGIRYWVLLASGKWITGHQASYHLYDIVDAEILPTMPLAPGWLTHKQRLLKANHYYNYLRLMRKHLGERPEGRPDHPQRPGWR